MQRLLFRSGILGAALALLAAAGPASRKLSPGPLDAGVYLEHVKYLASDSMKGRGTGTPELEKAARYIAGQFEQLGLSKPGGSHLQPFSVTTNARLGRRNRLEFVNAGRAEPLTAEKDFLPFNFSASGEFTGELVFAGYGITAKEYHYDDYEGIDVRGKFVIVLRHEPQEYDEKSVFAGKVYTEHAQFFSKAVNAKMHGARGVILVNDVGNHSGDADELELFAKTVGPRDAGIAFVQVKAAQIDKLLGAQGRTIAGIQTEIDKELKPQSFALPAGVAARTNVDVAREQKTVHNVVGYLAGSADEYLVIGAHYDHLGLGEQFSMAPSMAGKPHPGADDNASGTAGVLELARYFVSQPKPRRGILFIAFAGEELGLLGSSYFVNNPVLPIEKAVAMINMDMIGRIRDGKVYLGGMGTGTTFRALLEEVAKKSRLKFEFSDQTGYGSSDHTSFTAKQVPVLFFFSGLHADYHKPSDTWDKIDSAQATELLTSVSEVAARLVNGEPRPQFVRVAAPQSSAHSGVAPSGGGSGYGPYFGSIPDFNEPPKGVRFADVREGSPAAKGGLKGGDIMIEFDGKEIGNLYDFTYALRSRRAGDTVKVKVLRGSETVEAEVRLEARR
jgi:hypothetical protein